MAEEKNKEQLIGSILEELNELEMLTKGMQDPRMLEELAIKKARNLLQHYEQLRTADKDEEKAEEPRAQQKLQEGPKPEKVPDGYVLEDLPLGQDSRQATKKAEDTEATKAAEKQEVAETGTEVENTKTSIKQETAEPTEQTDKTGAKFAKPNSSESAKAQQPQVRGGRSVAFIDSLPIKSLRGALTMGDKFRYNTELFKGDMNLLNSTLVELDRKENLGDALSYINANFSWDAENEAVIDFMSLLERRFENKI